MLVGQCAERLAEPERIPQLLGRGWHDGRQAHRNRAKPFDRGVQHGVQPVTIRVVLREHPRLLFRDVQIQRVDDCPHRVDRVVNREPIDGFVRGLERPRYGVDDDGISVVEFRGGWHDIVAIPIDHGDDAAREVSETVRQLGLITRGEVLPRERPVLAKVDGAQEVIAERVGAEHVSDLMWSDASQF